MTRRWWVLRLYPEHAKPVDPNASVNWAIEPQSVVLAADYDRLRLKWTTEKPKVAGWYWWRELKDGKVTKILVQEITEAHIQNGTFYGEWCGPLAVPGELHPENTMCPPHEMRSSK